MKLINIFISSYWWARALNESSKDEYSKALISLAYREKYLVGKDLKTPLMKAFLLFASRQDDKCRVQCDLAIEQVISNDNISKVDALYLCSYAENFKICIDKLDQAGNKFLADTCFDLAKVTPKFIRLFPMKQLPEFALD